MIALYVLRGVTGKRYVGITNDLARRLSEHGAEQSNVRRLIGSFEVIYTEMFSDHASARIREKFLKSGQGRAWLDRMERQPRSAIGG